MPKISVDAAQAQLTTRPGKAVALQIPASRQDQPLHTLKVFTATEVPAAATLTTLQMQQYFE
jgi:hypothetical protein